MVATGEQPHVSVMMLVASDAYAGLERHVVQLSRHLRGGGCEVAIACPPSARRMREEAAAAGIPVLPGRRAPHAVWLLAVARAVRRRHVDVLHVHDGQSAVAAAFLRPLARSRLVRTQHFFEPASATRTGARRALSLTIQRLLNRRLSAFVAVSPSVAVASRLRREVPAGLQVDVIPPGVELADEPAVRRAAGGRAAAAAPVVAFIGRFEPEKQLDVLLNAVPSVSERVPACRFVLAGAGSAEGSLRALADELGVGCRISWPGWVPSSADVLEHIHVYVNPWPHEGFGMAMAEALSHGIPVVGVRSGASLDLVEPGVTGQLSAPGDPRSMADAICSLLEHPDRAEAIGRTGRERAVSRYGVGRAAELTHAMYRRIVAGERP